MTTNLVSRECLDNKSPRDTSPAARFLAWAHPEAGVLTTESGHNTLPHDVYRFAPTAESDSDLTNKHKAATEEAKAYNQQHQVSR
jgi:hypothetical protein